MIRMLNQGVRQDVHTGEGSSGSSHLAGCIEPVDGCDRFSAFLFAVVSKHRYPAHRSGV